MPAAPEITTVDNLSTDAIAAYRSRGFVHIPRVLTDDEIEELSADARRQLDREKTVSWDDDTGNVMDWVADPEIKSEAMRRLALHPRITAIAERLADVPLRLFKTELLRKPAHHSAVTPAHIDTVAFPFSGAPVGLTAWVALNDVPAERGCMSFIPGSHLADRRSAESADAWDPLSTRPELVWEPRVTVPVRAGGATFHHERIVHMAGANHTDADRISLATVYMPADAVFDPGPIDMDGDLTGLGPAILKELQPGRPMDHERFPLTG